MDIVKVARAFIKNYDDDWDVKYMREVLSISEEEIAEAALSYEAGKILEKRNKEEGTYEVTFVPKSKKKPIFLISTEGKTPEQVTDEAMEAFAKYKNL